MHLDPFRDLIKQRCGLHFEVEGEALLLSALQQRIAVTQTPTSSHYFTRLQGDEGEFHALVSLLTINETYFYREPEQLRFLVATLVPRLLADRAPGQPVRILSAGCSSGEEPFSMVMALRERYGAGVGQLCRVVGGDIDHQALAKARQGRYSAFSFRGLSPELRARYFTADDAGGYWLDPAIRDLVELRHLNLQVAVQEPELRGFDIIFFRNVSIYFDQETRRAIQAKLAELLTPRGVLVVGSTETLANDFGQLALVEEEGVFYFAKSPQRQRPGLSGFVPPRPAAPAASNPPAYADLAAAQAGLAQGLARWAAASSAPAFGAEGPGDAVEQAVQLVREERYDEALQVAERAAQSGAPQALLLQVQAHIHLNRRAFDQALAAARQAVELDGWSVDACYLMGQIHRWRGIPEEAAQWLRRAVYISPECWPAHYALAELYRSGGELEQAQREYRIVLRHLSGASGKGEGALLFPLAVSQAEMRGLCQRQLANLGADG